MKFAAENKKFSDMYFVNLQNEDWFEKQKHAGQVVAKCLTLTSNFIKYGAPTAGMQESPKLTLKYLEEQCEYIIANAGCTPTFKGYNGFPGAICASVNKDLVHGIPSDYVLVPGDVVKIDLGATYEGVIADAAMTTICGGNRSAKDPKHVELIESCKVALQKGIEAVKVGDRIGAIGNAIYKYTRNTGFSLITKYGGHGIALNKPHAPPFVSNKAKPDDGVTIQPGLTIAIEPMLVIGGDMTETQSDNWTVKADGICAHFEHTLYVGEDKVHIMTELNDV